MMTLPIHSSYQIPEKKTDNSSCPRFQDFILIAECIRTYINIEITPNINLGAVGTKDSNFSDEHLFH